MQLAQPLLREAAHELHAPDERQYRGRNPEADDVRQRIHLAPEIAVVLVMRAIRPSRPSRNTAQPMAVAATFNCSSPRCGLASPFENNIAPRKERNIEMKPRKIFPAVNIVGNA